jgi:hypothetical protein
MTFAAVHCIFHISTVTTCDTFWEYLVKLHSLLHISICEVLLSGAKDCDFNFFYVPFSCYLHGHLLFCNPIVFI